MRDEHVGDVVRQTSEIERFELTRSGLHDGASVFREYKFIWSLFENNFAIFRNIEDFNRQVGSSFEQGLAIFDGIGADINDDNVVRANGVP